MLLCLLFDCNLVEYLSRWEMISMDDPLILEYDVGLAVVVRRSPRKGIGGDERVLKVGACLVGF